MKIDLHEKVAIITGSTEGIWQGEAKQLAQCGGVVDFIM